MPTTRDLSRLYFPLAISWVCMAMESPISVSILSRMPDAQLHTAGFFVLMALSLFIESPVIDLLSTSTTFSRHTANFNVVKRFALVVSISASVVHALVALTPLFDVVTRGVIGLPDEVREVLRVPFAIVIPWSALIGWRRFWQGALIRAGVSRPISVGTLLRVSTIAGVGYALHVSSDLNGLTVIACALVSSVAIEAAFIYAVASGIVRESLSQLPAPESPTVTLPELLKFHLPLTGTTMLNLAAGPMIIKALGLLPDPVAMSAAWQVQSSLLWMARTATYALPEVVIRYAMEADEKLVSQFCRRIGWTLSLILLFMVVTGLDRLIMVGAMDVAPDTANLAHIALMWGVALPIIGALGNFARGMLTAHGVTVVRLKGIAIGMISLALGLAGGVLLKRPGIEVAAFAQLGAQLIEYLYLRFAWKRHQRIRSTVVTT